MTFLASVQQSLKITGQSKFSTVWLRVWWASQTRVPPLPLIKWNSLFWNTTLIYLSYGSNISVFITTQSTWAKTTNGQVQYLQSLHLFKYKLSLKTDFSLLNQHWNFLSFLVHAQSWGSLLRANLVCLH